MKTSYQTALLLNHDHTLAEVFSQPDGGMGTGSSPSHDGYVPRDCQRWLLGRCILTEDGEADQDLQEACGGDRRHRQDVVAFRVLASGYATSGGNEHGQATTLYTFTIGMFLPPV